MRQVRQFNRSIRESGLLAIGAFATCVALAVFASTRVKPTYTADAKLLFIKVDNASALSDFGEGQVDRLESLLNDQTPLTTQMQVIQSRPILQETVEILGLRGEDGELLEPESLRANLDVGIVSGTDVLEINYVSDDPETAAAVVNTIIDRYREYAITQNRSEASEAKEFLLAQLPQSDLAVRQAETELRDFLEQNNVGVLEDEATALVRQIETLSGQAATVQSTLDGTIAQANTIQGKLGLSPQQAFVVGTIRQNPGVQEALLDLQAVERQIAAEQAQFKPGSPVMRQLQAEKESLQGFLQEQIAVAGGAPNVPLGKIQGAGGADDDIAQVLIRNFLDAEVEYIGLQQQLETLRNYQEDYQQRLLNIPSLSTQKRALERRVTVAESTYSALLTRIQELQVQENEATYNTRVIEPATPPVEANGGEKKKYLAIGVFAGAVVALAIVIAAQVMSSPVSEEAKKRALVNTSH